MEQCVWLYFRFALSYRNIEEMMAKRGVPVTYETVREWCRKLGPSTLPGCCTRRDWKGLLRKLEHSHCRNGICGVWERMQSDLNGNLDLATLAAESGYGRAQFLQMFRGHRTDATSLSDGIASSQGSSPHFQLIAVVDRYSCGLWFLKSRSPYYGHPTYSKK